MFQYYWGIFMHINKIDILPIKFKPYFTNVNKINNHLTRFSETNCYFLRVKSLYGLKSLSYLGCKMWEECQETLKIKAILKHFNMDWEIFYLKDNQKNIKLNLYIPLIKLISLYWCLSFFFGLIAFGLLNWV